MAHAQEPLMVERKVRILLGKLGEGHKEALQSLARNFSEAGFEVIYTELQEPEVIVTGALLQPALSKGRNIFHTEVILAHDHERGL